MYSPAPTSYMPGAQGQPQLTLAQLMQLRQMMPQAFGQNAFANPQMAQPQGMQMGMPPQGLGQFMPPQMGQQGLGAYGPPMNSQSTSLGARSLR